MKTDSKESSKSHENLDRDTTLLHTLTDNMSGYIACANADTLTYEYANKAYQKSFGVPVNKIIGAHIRDVIGEKAYEVALKYIAEAKKGKQVSYENLFDMKNGKRWLKVNYSPIFNKAGKVISIIVLSYDITEQKKTEEELKEQKQFIESLINLSQDICYIYDIIDKKNAYCNDGIRKVLGYSIAEIQKMDNKLLSIVMHPDDMKKYLAETVPRYTKAKDGEIIFNEYRMKHKNGTWIWLECNEQIYNRNDNGSPRQIFGVIHDISNRKKTEEELRQSEEKYRSIFNNSAIGIFRTRLDGSEILEFNDKYCAILGVKRKDVVGKPSKVLWVNTKEREKMVKTLKSTGHVDELQFQLKREDGEILDCITSLKLYPEQKILEGSIIDITEKKEAEEVLKKSQDTLKTKIADLEKFQNIVINRELKMIELKERIKELEEKNDKK